MRGIFQRELFQSAHYCNVFAHLFKHAATAWYIQERHGAGLITHSSMEL